MSQPTSRQRWTVLVVDDETRIRTLMARILESAGYQVLTATDGVDALARLNEAEEVHLVVTDVVMPRMDGGKLAEHCVARTPPPKLLFVTGFASPTRTRGLPGPLLRKPFTAEQLIAAVTELLAT